MTGRTLLCLDLGTSTGWALRLPTREVHSGTEGFRPGRFEGGGMRYLRFSRWLSQVTGCEPDAVPAGLIVMYEEVRGHKGTDAAHIYGGLMATLTAWCEQRSVPYQAVPVGTIKKFATGKGNAGKDAVTAAVRAWGHSPGDDNEADALALMEWAVAEDPGMYRSRAPKERRKATR